MGDLDIELDRGDTANILKLDQDEQDILNTIEIETRPSKPFKKKVMRQKAPRNVSFQNEEAIRAFTNPQKLNMPEYPEVVDYQESEESYQEEPQEQFYEEAPQEDTTSVDEEKTDILSKLARLEKKGVRVNKRLNMYSSIEELRAELKRASYGIEIDHALRFSKRMLVACVTGIEFLNKRYNPFDLQLEGWSESVMENTDDYDDVFEELYNKYKGNMKVAPELRLIMMLGGSAMMFHLTNSMFKTAIPNVNDVLKQNPDLVKNMMSAVQNTAQNNAKATPPLPGGQRDMKGPGMDISSLMGGIMMPPIPPVNTSVMDEVEIAQETESVSDIISISGQSDTDVKDVNVSKPKGRRGRPRKKAENEVNL